MKELQRGIKYIIPCSTQDGEMDKVSIEVYYNAHYKCDIVYLNNINPKFHLEKISPNANTTINWFKIEENFKCVNEKVKLY